MKIRMLLKKPNLPLTEIHEEDRLENYYWLLNCGCIEFYYPFKERPDICVILDEEGRINQKHVSWRAPDGQGLCGTIIFSKDDGLGNLTSLNDEDVKFIKSKCKVRYRTLKSDWDIIYRIVGW